MKKRILSIACVMAFASYATAEEMPQAIITDCGTIHQIPSDSTVDDAIGWIDFWSVIDC